MPSTGILASDSRPRALAAAVEGTVLTRRGGRADPAHRPAVESRARDHALAPAGPELQAYLGLLAAGLHEKPRERRAAGRPAAGFVEHARDAPPVGRAQVLHDDRVEDDARHTPDGGGEAGGEPRGRAGGVDRDRDPASHLERAAEKRDALALVGPQAREERDLPVGRAGVDGQHVAAGALDHAAATPAGREAVREHVDQTHRRRAVAPPRIPLLVAVVVPAQVQPRARADLEQAERQAGLARDEQEAAEERGRAPHLVGLTRAPDERAQRVAVLLERVAERRPGAVEPRLAARRRVVARERRRAALEHEPVHGAQEAQRERRADGIPLVALEHCPARPTHLDVGGRLLEQRRVERGAGTPRRLLPEPPRDRVLRGAQGRIASRGCRRQKTAAIAAAARRLPTRTSGQVSARSTGSAKSMQASRNPHSKTTNSSTMPKPKLGLRSAIPSRREAATPMIRKASTWTQVKLSTISKSMGSASGDPSPAPPRKRAVPRTVGVKRGRPFTPSSARNQRAMVAAPTR